MVLVGDPQQLPATILSELAKQVRPANLLPAVPASLVLLAWLTEK